MRPAWLAAFLALAAPAAAEPSATLACDGMLTSGGTPPARWVELPEPQAPGGRVFTEASRQRVSDRYPICVFAAPVARDVDVTLRFRPIDGRMDRAGGIAVRVRDADTYYVLRANAAEDNVRLYHVTRGRRVQFAGAERVPIALNAWHTLRLRAQGDGFTAWLDEAKLFEARDGRVADAGRVALWSIADSHTLFETPRIEVLP